MIDIAFAAKNNEPVSLRGVALRQGIPENYLEQLMIHIKKAGLVDSVRGAQGGYILKKSAGEISAGDILRALEGSLSPVNCLDSEDAACGTGDCSVCGAKTVWNRMYAGMNSAIDTITLEELVRNYTVLKEGSACE